MNISERLKHARKSYNDCGICGHIPNSNDEPNYAPLRWWDADDGWKIGALCRPCAVEALPVQPKPDDFAFPKTNHVADSVNTDEDPIDALTEFPYDRKISLKILH